MGLTHQDVQKILAILDQADCEEVHLEFGDLKLDFRKHGKLDDARRAQPHEATVSPQVSPQMTKVSGEATTIAVLPTEPETGRKETLPEGVVAVISPMLGTCYRAPSPGAKPFVEVGSSVRTDDTVCLVEVMKLFSSLKAGVAGTVEKILFENATLVEYGQPLIWIRKDVA